MAAQNNTDNFYNEILSPSELFAARSRSHKIPVRGQKDFFPNDSEEQQQRLEQSLSEHWSLVSEERVERLGTLVKGTWIPSQQIVELQSPAGKFWQTMGFSANGRQCLLPEEALYLMECGTVQVFYQDLPLSVQDGYESFLSSNAVSLQQYQVFGHLKRLGYVVHRFDPRSEPSLYARQLNLPQSRDQAGRQLKRKRSASPTLTCSLTEVAVAERTEATCSGGSEEGSRLTPYPQMSEAQTDGADICLRRTWWMVDAPGDDGSHADQCSSSSSSRWDSSILFPDLGSSGTSGSCLASPDPSLLPGALSVGICDVTCWLQRINLRKVKMSPKEEERERDGQRRRGDINKDREVQRCRNWAEYRELLARRQARRSGQPAHLWNQEVTPLHDPTQPIPTGELLEKLCIIKSSNLLEGASRLKASDEWKISFTVYQPDTVADFKKSKPGKPFSHLCVCSFQGAVPDLRAIKLLSFQSAGIPLVFAVVDHGDISFYSFKDFQLPADVYP
ncbi:tRNA-splicing endonuclease subunit Sen54 [Aulostomus maculatus]